MGLKALSEAGRASQDKQTDSGRCQSQGEGTASTEGSPCGEESPGNYHSEKGTET